MADIGPTLRETRMRARIDISEVEARTKIRAKYLRAIENEEWDLLPGPVFVKSFLRTYGDYLGLDSRLLVDEFKRRYERPSDHDVRPISTRQRDRERERERTRRAARGPLVPGWALISVILVGIVVALYVIGNSGAGHKPTNNPTPASVTSTTHKSGKPGTHTTANTTTTHTTTPPAARTPSNASLKLAPTGTVWICVQSRARGKLTTVVPGTIFTAGQTVPSASGSEILVTLGNAAVTVTADGKPYPLTASASAIGLKVTNHGVSPLAAGQGPVCS